MANFRYDLIIGSLEVGGFLTAQDWSSAKEELRQLYPGASVTELFEIKE